MRINADLDTIHIGVSAPTNKEELWLYTSENLYSSSNETGNISTSNGQESSSTSFSRTHNYIPVEGSTTYSIKISGTTQIVVLFYNNNYSYLNYENCGSGISTATFTTPVDCSFIRFRFSGTAYANSNCMLVKGSTPQDYQTYYKPILKAKDINSNTYNNIINGAFPIRESKVTSNIDAYSCTYVNKLNVLSNWNYTNSAIDVNNCTESGLYFFDVGARNSTNAPTTWNTSKLLLIINCQSGGNSGGGILQIWFDTYSQDRNPRFRQNTWGSWTEWKKISIS